MTESKILSIRLNSDFHKDFSEFCTRNEISKKQAFIRAFELVLKAEKTENKERSKFPAIPLPPL